MEEKSDYDVALCRHRGPLGEYPTSLADGEILEDKRTPIPPPMKSSRDQSEGILD